MPSGHHLDLGPGDARHEEAGDGLATERVLCAPEEEGWYPDAPEQLIAQEDRMVETVAKLMIGGDASMSLRMV